MMRDMYVVMTLLTLMTSQATPCTATLVLYLVAGDPDLDIGNPESSMGITRVERLVQELALKVGSRDLLAVRVLCCFSLVKISSASSLLDFLLSLELLRGVVMSPLWMATSLLGEGISFEVVKQMSPTLWNLPPFFTRLLVTTACLSALEPGLSKLSELEC